MPSENQPNNQPAKKVSLPTLQDLHQDIDTAFKNDQLNLLVNQPVPASWIKDHPFAKSEGKPIKYIPIDKVEFLLTKIFQRWRFEVTNVGQLFNSVYVQGRLHYLNPTNDDWDFQDGVGAVGVQTEAGASASNMEKIRADAVMKALPAAKSYALKDAAENIGIIFGKNLNRKDTLGFTPSFTDRPENQWDIPNAQS